MNDKTPDASRIHAVRHFNRFYTRHVGALNEGLLESSFSLVEMRVIYELGNRRETTAARLARDLGHDPAYLSRIVKSFRDAGLVESRPSAEDARQNLLRLTDQGQRIFERYNAASSAEVATVLKRLSPGEQARLVEAMATIEGLLTARGPDKAPYLLRPHRPGDMGWIIHRQALLYTREYGWDGSFEALLAEISTQFLQTFDPTCEQSWIAEIDETVVGSVFLVKLDAETAKLRMLYVDGAARGLGIGRRLVRECIRAARGFGYKRLRLWTNDILVEACHIYESEGFYLVEEEPHHSFGKDLVGQIWDLDL